MLYANILELSASLKACPFINYIQERAAANVYNINNNIIVKLNIVLQGKAEATQGLTIFLTEVIVLSKVFKSLFINIMSYSVKYSIVFLQMGGQIYGIDVAVILP